MAAARLIVGAIERAKRERILVAGEEVRLDGVLRVQHALAYVRVARKDGEHVMPGIGEIEGKPWGDGHAFGGHHVSTTKLRR